MKTPTDRIEAAVRERYSEAAGSRVEALCCSTVYDDRYLEVLPDEILERDYGCGDPSRHLAPGESVLDLGSGGGKICFIASQVVGPEGTGSRAGDCDLPRGAAHAALGRDPALGDGASGPAGGLGARVVLVASGRQPGRLECGCTACAPRRVGGSPSD